MKQGSQGSQMHQLDAEDSREKQAALNEVCALQIFLA